MNLEIFLIINLLIDFVARLLVFGIISLVESAHLAHFYNLHLSRDVVMNILYKDGLELNVTYVWKTGIVLKLEILSKHLAVALSTTKNSLSCFMLVLIVL